MTCMDDKEEPPWAEEAAESGVMLSLGRREGGRKGILVLLCFIVSAPLQVIGNKSNYFPQVKTFACAFNR